MRFFLFVFVVVIAVAVASAQFPKRTSTSGRYEPPKRKQNNNSGKYSGSDGRYVPIDSGKYTGGFGDKGAKGGGYKHVIGPDGKDGKDTKYVPERTTQKPTPPPTRRVPVVSYKNQGGWKIVHQERTHDAPYHYLYETENKIITQEDGKINYEGTENEALRSTGFYEYTGDDGQRYRVDYVADENGYVPQAAHIPTPPPTPDSVLRALEYLRKTGQL